MTPGPWTVFVQKDGGNWDWQIRTVEPHNPAGGLGKHVATANKYLHHVEANAQVLAAAPEMYDALVDMAAAYERGLDLPWGTLQAAIEKATVR
jgi:hypothetical protein